MKKTLLLTAVAAVALSASAQTDITPTNYKFNETGKVPNFHPLLCGQTENQTNINVYASNIWENIHGDDYFDNGLIVISSGGGINQTTCTAIIDSWNVIDFGGEIGKAVVYIGKDSGFKEYLLDYFPERADEWNTLKVMPDYSFGGAAFNFFLDPKNCPTTGYIHAKFVFSVFHPTMPESKAIQYIGVRGNQNDNQSEWNGVKYTQDEPSGNKAVNFTACMDDDTGEWDPKKWVEYEFDFTVAKPDGDTKYTPMRMKMFPMNGNVPEKMALMIRSVEFTHYDSGAPDLDMLGKRDFNVVDIEHELDNPDVVTTGIGEVAAEEAPASYTINGNTVTFSAPAVVFNLVGQKVAQGTQATLAGGVYVAKVGTQSVKFVVR